MNLKDGLNEYDNPEAVAETFTEGRYLFFKNRGENIEIALYDTDESFDVSMYITKEQLRDIVTTMLDGDS